MSDARWCNFGNHAFDGARTDTLLIGKLEQVPNQWGGQQPHKEVIKEICGDCAALQGLSLDYQAPESPTQRHDEIRKELENGEKGRR